MTRHDVTVKDYQAYQIDVESDEQKTVSIVGSQVDSNTVYEGCIIRLKNRVTFRSAPYDLGIPADKGFLERRREQAIDEAMKKYEEYLEKP